MSDNLGWLVVNNNNGYLLEGKDHAARIFEKQDDAQVACGVQHQAVRITYTALVQSLDQGAPFCFDTEAGHAKFLRRLRNDISRKPFAKLSQDRAYIRWRTSEQALPASAGPAAPVATGPLLPAAPPPPTGPAAYNPEILVRPG